MASGADGVLIEKNTEDQTMGEAMAQFVAYVEETFADNAARASAFKGLLLDIADGTWGFPPLFEQWRKNKPIR